LTCGTHTLKQTPSAMLSEWHVGGAAPPELMNESGTQKLMPSEHCASCAATLAGTIADGTQWALGESAQTAAPHGGNVDGSIGVSVGAAHSVPSPLPSDDGAEGA
jgi:hypothetical protein